MTAANPAALKVECPDGRHILCISEVERIRVLERDNEALCMDADSLRVANKELTAMLYELRSQRDYAIEARLDDVKDEAAVEMRVEEERRTVLEARVKELTAMLYELRSQRDYAMAIQEDRER